MDARLDSRVDAMVTSGMLHEIETVYHQLCKIVPSGDFVVPSARSIKDSDHDDTAATATSSTSTVTAATRDYQWYTQCYL